MSGLTIPVDTLIIPIENTQDPRFQGRVNSLQATYTQLFKENRDLSFFRNEALDSAYLDGRLNTRQLVCQLLSSEMYRDYIFAVNSNYRFVELCFERVLGRPASQAETMTWSSLLATQGLNGFAEALTDSEEYSTAFGDTQVPARRSAQLFSSNQGLPALPEQESNKRYDGPGREAQKYSYTGGSTYPWTGSRPPALLQKIGAVLVVAGVIEVTRVVLTIAASALLG